MRLSIGGTIISRPQEHVQQQRQAAPRPQSVTASHPQATMPAPAAAHARAFMASDCPVFDMDEDEEWSRGWPKPDQPGSHAPSTGWRSAMCLSFQSLSSLPRTDPIAKVQRSVAAHRREMGVASDATSELELQCLAAAVARDSGFSAVSLCRPSRAVPGIGGPRFLGNPSLFLLVRASGPHHFMTDIIIEPNFRAIFSVGLSASSDYARRLAQAPEIFVGSRAELLEQAAELSAALANNFLSQGLPTPPWRERTALLARWAVPAAELSPARAHASSPELMGRAHSSEGMLPQLQTRAAASNAGGADQQTPALPIAVARNGLRECCPSSSSEGTSSEDDLAVSPDSVLTRSVRSNVTTINSKANTLLKDVVQAEERDKRTQREERALRHKTHAQRMDKQASSQQQQLKPQRQQQQQQQVNQAGQQLWPLAGSVALQLGVRGHAHAAAVSPGQPRRVVVGFAVLNGCVDRGQ